MKAAKKAPAKPTPQPTSATPKTDTVMKPTAAIKDTVKKVPAAKVDWYDESSGFAEHEMKSPALSLSAFVRSSARPLGFPLHVGYLHKSINGAWRQGGLGAGESMNGDFALHAVRIAMAPEFAMDSTSRAAMRIGIEARLAFAGRFEGRSKRLSHEPTVRSELLGRGYRHVRWWAGGAAFLRRQSQCQLRQ